MEKISNKYITIFALTFLLLSLFSCKKYLELKPNGKLVIPKSLNDCQALLDNYSVMNAQYPADGEIASDNYYVSGADYLSLENQQDRDTYVWSPVGEHLNTQWLVPYQVVYTSNLVLQTLNDMNPSAPELKRWKEIKGAALFFRAYAFHQIAQIFAAPYNPATASKEPGIPIRLSPDLAVVSVRGTLAETYHQITSDFEEALDLLPIHTILPTRPNKTAAFAALARTYLSMQDYLKSGDMANECLKLKGDLINYNTVNLDGGNPFTQFNTEVIFHTLSAPTNVLDPGFARINPEFLDIFENGDLRLKAFFEDQGDGTFGFKGNYNGASYGTEFFNGLATDEIYLIRAECYARAGKASLAADDLNLLLKNRFDAAHYTLFNPANVHEALAKVLEERRKELAFRNLRWQDLRRLNQDPDFAITLKRTLSLNGAMQVYTLMPNDLRYTFLIPIDVIVNAGIQQNRR